MSPADPAFTLTSINVNVPVDHARGHQLLPAVSLVATTAAAAELTTSPTSDRPNRTVT